VPSVYSETGTDTGGWGETWTFIVNVTDEDLDNVTVSLQTRKYGSGTWVTRNTTVAVTPLNATINMTLYSPTVFQDDQGIWEYRFTASENACEHGTCTNTDQTAAANFTVEKDNVTVMMVDGDGDSIWRFGTQSVNMSLFVYDTDRDMAVDPPGAGKIWSTYNGSLYNDGWDLTTNNGYLNVSFNPECSDTPFFVVGPHNWLGGIVNDTYYFDKNSSVYSWDLYSNMAVDIVTPDGESYERGGKVNISSVTDECGFPVMNADSFTVQAKRNACSGSFCWYTCSDKNEGSGWYNCSWQTQPTYPPAWYDARIIINKQYYATNDSIKPNAFYLGNTPDLYNQHIDHYEGGWGEQYDFYMCIDDQDQNENNITLLKSFDTETWSLTAYHSRTLPWTPICSEQFPQYFTGHMNTQFTCQDYLDGPLAYFKFNTTDVSSFTDETGEYYSGAIQTAQNESGLNYTHSVSENAPMSFYNITIENLNGSTIYYNLTVNGLQVASNQSIPAGANSTTDAVAAGASFTLPGDQSINLTIMDASGSASNATYNAYLEYYAGLMELTLQTDNITATIDDTNSSDEVRREGAPQATLTFRIRDDDASVYPTGASGLVWIKQHGDYYTTVLMHNATVASSGVNHTEPVTGSGSVIYFNVTLENLNGSTIYYNLTVNGAQLLSNQSVADSSNSTTDAVSSGVSITVPGNQTVNITVMDASGQPANATFNAYLQYLPGLINLSCTTTAGGYCQVTYNPTCESRAGIQKWYGETNDVCYETEYTTTDEDLTVYGQLYVTPEKPKEGSVINRNTTVNLSAFVKDECGSYVNDTSVTWYNDIWSQIAVGYDANWSVPYDYPLGPETLRTNTSRQYFDGNTNTTNVLV
ncbi:MAG: hypothetical protein JRI36_13230, partial [Deltaproteobacteria bacterium]|nr:hypothetical protein [Deltaproteobacteria bacterium]